MNCSPPRFSVHMISQARILEWIVISFSGDLPRLGIEPPLLHWQADSLPLSHQGHHFTTSTKNYISIQLYKSHLHILSHLVCIKIPWDIIFPILLTSKLRLKTLKWLLQAHTQVISLGLEAGSMNFNFMLFRHLLPLSAYLENRWSVTRWMCVSSSRSCGWGLP